MTSKGIQASDIIPDGADFAQINGVQVRKGRVGANNHRHRTAEACYLQE